jgi:hypothetical protein
VKCDYLEGNGFFVDTFPLEYFSEYVQKVLLPAVFVVDQCGPMGCLEVVSTTVSFAFSFIRSFLVCFFVDRNTILLFYCNNVEMHTISCSHELRPQKMS